MDLRKTFTSIYSITLVLLVALGVSSIIMFQTLLKLKDSHESRYKSFAIANELKQSSDDLTRFCRTYVLTQDDEWENKYWEVLAIRNGEKPRPSGRIISLQDSMRKLGFSELEFEKLKESENKSVELVWTETVAFNAMKGLFNDGSGQFTIQKEPDLELAKRILFDEQYHAHKTKIMIPIKEFIDLVDMRTDEKVKKYSRMSNVLIRVVIGFVFIISLISMASYFKIKTKIVVQISELLKAKAVAREKEINLIEQHKNILTQNEEINSQNEELLAQNELLEELNDRIQQNEKRIKEAKESLDKKVKERTLELNRTVKKLNKTVLDLDKFVYSASHDLSAPLKSILGIVNLVKLDQIDHSTEEKLNYIEKSIRQLEHVIKSLIEFSRNSRIESKFEEINFREFLQSCFDELKFLNFNDEISFIHHYDDALVVKTDVLRLKIIINNLLSNAIKYRDTYKRHQYIRVSVHIDQDYWEVTVEDNGIGIGSEYRDKVFDMFYRATELSDGSGLGLFIVKETIDKLNGEIRLNSNQGEGTAIQIKFNHPHL